MEDRLQKNYLFELKPNTNIYRYTTINRLFQMFEKKKLVLVQPNKWDDPFENLLSKMVFYDNGNKLSLRSISEEFVGQCWTKSKECDGLWRNYTDMKNHPNSGVKITTQVKKLLNYVANCKHDKLCTINTYIGNVIYKQDKKILDFFRQIDINWIADPSGHNPAQTLFIKRNEFKYENEVRVIKSIHQKQNDFFINNSLEEGKYYLDIDPYDLISSIVFSPMMDEKIYHKYKEKLVQLGFKQHKISKSTLYDSFKEPIVIH